GQGLIVCEIDGKSLGDRSEGEIAVLVEDARERVGRKSVNEARQLEGNASLGDVEEAALSGAHDRAVEAWVGFILLRPQQLLDRVLEQFHTALDRRIVREPAEPVVEQERRRRPDADQ